ncbi:hypothetical protein COPRO5265_01950 [Coprothermobacter proteolyticus DSM 5265]|nr:hypothetical protein COPRO5265_01950 [Coprothermobacter proteolyticus DSM 5265]
MAGKLSGKVTIYYAVDFLKGLSELPRGHGLVAKETCQASKQQRKAAAFSGVTYDWNTIQYELESWLSFWLSE